MDKFLLNIDVTGEKLRSTVFVINHAIRDIKGKLYLINYSNLDIEGYFDIKEKSKEFVENTKKIREHMCYVIDPVKSFNWIKSQIQAYTSTDTVMIIGVESLMPYKDTKAAIEANYFELNSKIHFLEEENWSVLSHELDTIFYIFQETVNGIYVNLFANELSRDKVIEYLEDSNNMSIISCESPSKNVKYEILQRETIEKLSTLSLKDSIELLNNSEEELGKTTYNYLSAISYYRHGEITKSILLLEEVYNELLNEGKVILIDLYTIVEKKDRAKKIIDELYHTDKYLKGLYPAILRCYPKAEKEHDYWLDIAIKYDPENLTVKELLANRYVKAERYLDAAAIFREMSNDMNSTYYELVARMNEVLDGKYKKPDDYIFDLVKEFPVLRNEAVYRLAKYYIDKKNSPFNAYKILKRADYVTNTKRIDEIIELKIEILSDDVLASRALGKIKPFYKDNDRQILIEVRSKELVDIIESLAVYRNSYLSWREYIEKSQNEKAWKLGLYKVLLIKIDMFSKKKLEELVQKSFIKNVESEGSIETSEKLEENPEKATINTIILLRRIRTGDFDYKVFEDFGELVKTVLTLPEVFDDNYFRIITRYYLSIIATLHGFHQDANNLALSIFDYIDNIQDELKPKALMFGLLAWGNSQYRLGRVTEGIACILASIKYVFDSNEIYPFLEDGLNLIAKFLIDEIGSVALSDRDKFDEFNEIIKAYSLTFSRSWNILIGNTIEEINVLQKNVKDIDQKDVTWAGDMVNLISLIANNKEFDEAEKLIHKHYKDVFRLLESRIDLRFKALYNWAQILFVGAKSLNDYFVIVEILELADKDIIVKRKVFHKEERVGVSYETIEVYRFTLQIYSLIISFESMTGPIRQLLEQKIEAIMVKISPRSTIEQKKYYKDGLFTEECLHLESRYKIVVEEYRNLFSQNSSDLELLSNKAKEAEDIKSKLIEIHPHYKSLEDYNGFRFETVQNKLKEGEVFYQYVIMDVCILTITISRDIVKLNTKLVANTNDEIRNLVFEFSNAMQKPMLDISEVNESIVKNISELIAEDLFNYVHNYETKSIYCMPDTKIGMFPITISERNGYCLIELVNSIVNVIDYSFLYTRENKASRIINRIFGNANDSELKKIERWIDNRRSENFLKLDNKNDDLFELKKSIAGVDEVDILALYSHGVPYTNGGMLDGAHGIQGMRSILMMQDILRQVNNVECLFLVSCRGGTPYYENVEISSGTWSAIFERFNGSIIICKWDVPTDSTIELIDILINQIENKDISISEALLISQREMKKKYPNQAFWGGVEIWEN
ncbi:conserved protein of unknown function [Petrocella atlantisensis]|uniref:Uncharacterized protein n=1 Tax=Petrocella atlantisensis TaxID=2173034 RepID=A0A3P7RX51_9FIRM|nr:hypothetical protein [Petrocella atlantisensis]VDN47316.1 conserved protein of unknown function [Petrocella atlantisensis]